MYASKSCRNQSGTRFPILSILTILLIALLAAPLFGVTESVDYGYKPPLKANLSHSSQSAKATVDGDGVSSATANPTPALVVAPTHIGPPTWTKPGTFLDIPVRFTNPGTSDLHFSAVNIFYKASDPYIGWISYNPPFTVIPYMNPNYIDITFTLGGVTPTMGVGLTGGLEFITDSPTSPDTFNIYLIVADTVQFPEIAIIHTDCVPLALNNAGQLGRGSYASHLNHNLNFYDDCDTTHNILGAPDNAAVYLYEASPFILRITPQGDTVLDSYMYFADWLDRDGFRPLEGLTVDSTSDASVMVAKMGKFLSHDSLISIYGEIYAPQAPDSCKFMVQKLYVSQNLEMAPSNSTMDLYMGELMDWDIPSDLDMQNGSDFDESSQLLYCYGAEIGSYETPNDNCVLSNDRLGTMVFYGGYRVPHSHKAPFSYLDSFPDIKCAWTGTNNDWTFPTNGWVPGQLYTKMSDFVGYEAWQSQHPEILDSLYQDLNMVSVYGRYNLGSHDTLVFVSIFSTTYEGLSGLQSNITEARNWISEHNIFQWPPLGFGCCYTENAGDANYDGLVNLLDILFLIDYLYGNPPGEGNEDCPELMSPNGDGEINLLDVLYLIDYLYGSPHGPNPLCAN